MASKLAHLGTALLFRSSAVAPFSPRPSSPSLFRPSLHFFPRLWCSSPAEPSAGVAVTPPPHPWPEWVEFVDWLTEKGYFTEDSLSFVDESNKERLYKDMGILKEACFSFARDRYDHIGSLSRDDIEVIVRDGCPSTLRKVVNSGKRLRAYIGLNEKDVCGSCTLRGNCDRAYMTLQDTESAARTLDVIRVMLFYALDQNLISGFERPVGREVVEASTRKLFSELLRLSQEARAPAPPKPVAPVRIRKERPLSSRDENQEFDKASMNSMDENQEFDEASSKKLRNWLCPKCNNLNFRQRLHCNKCKVGRPKGGPTTKNATREGDWPCPKCSYMNFSRNRHCLFCKADGPNVDGSGNMKKGDWICPGCQFMNFSSNKQCKDCEEPRPERELSTGEWECPTCDFVNSRKNNICPKCNHTHPGKTEMISEYEEQMWTNRS